jgi:hypothetical protein
LVSPNHLKTTLEAGGADELTKQIELSIVRKKMRLLLRLARDIIMINKNSGKHFARHPYRPFARVKTESTVSSTTHD